MPLTIRITIEYRTIPVELIVDNINPDLDWKTKLDAAMAQMMQFIDGLIEKNKHES